jgi:hypothetical protein
MSQEKLTITCICGKTISITPNLHQMTQAIVNHAKTHKPEDIDKTIYLLTAEILNTVAAIP